MTRITVVWVGGLLAVASVGCSLPPNELGNLEAKSFGATPDVPLDQVAFDMELVNDCGEGDPLSDKLTRTTYLQQVESDRAQLLWAAEDPLAQAVEVTRPDGALVERLASEPDPDGEALPGSHQYRAELSGLEPDSVYCYALVDDAGALTSRTGFRTAPAPGQTTRLSFLAFGDSGYRGIDQEAVFDQMRSLPADLALAAGDLAYGRGTLQELEELYFEPYAPMLKSLPVYTVLGNHDYGTASGAPYRAVFSLPDNGGEQAHEGWWSFDRGPVHFVGLDSEAHLERQAQWLDEDLNRNQLPWVVVMIHRPPYSSGSHGSDTTVRRVISPVVEAHHVQLVITGHDHHYERTHPIGGTTYIVTGGGGVGTRPVGHSSFTAFSASVAHFLFVNVDGQDMRVYAVDATGQVFDFAHIVLSDSDTGGSS